ncbi:hypothetical protein Dsin_024157 [Dipteronia sinensis]|uniref:RNase H type-1 domain-containing protein n=1 Tax=Dipteronia sinensis TaxID=43782 RepID=A0AAE0E2T1_9ROSI|nr:hypothetical protein Dsin_024157 [Dipteronia sinensis]
MKGIIERERERERVWFEDEENLWKRRVVASPRCDKCADLVESISHAIFCHLKLNTAVVIRKNVRSIGVEAAIQDDKGLVIAALSIQLPGLFNADIGELIALREGLLLVHLYNLQIDSA